MFGRSFGPDWPSPFRIALYEQGDFGPLTISVATPRRTVTRVGALT